MLLLITLSIIFSKKKTKLSKINIKIKLCEINTCKYVQTCSKTRRPMQTL